jgi:hypothetical protein
MMDAGLLGRNLMRRRMFEFDLFVGIVSRIDSKMPEGGNCTGLELNSMKAVSDHSVPKRRWDRLDIG